MGGGFSACRHGRSGRAAVGGGIGQLRVGILPRLLGGAMRLGRKTSTGYLVVLSPFFTPQ